MLKNNQGITLLSLVVTIIVLLIIASVSIASGNATIKYIKFTNAKAQLEAMQSKVNEWYQESKENEEILNYGVETTDSSCDKQKLANTASAIEGRDVTGYRYFTAKYIKEELGIEGISYSFLINVSKQSVLLFGGIQYDGITYYSVEQFGLKNIDYEDISGTITFDTAMESGNIVVYNVKFPDDINISKYKVQYQLPETDYWNTLTSDSKGVYSTGTEDVDSWLILAEVNGTYKIKITTASDNIKSEIKSVSVNN